MPIISVIVTIYNAELWIKRCLNSILSSSLKDIEIILVDDGSTDHSLEIIQGYAKSDNRIIVIHTPNGGPGHARNIGIDKSKGKYVMFVDSDDFITSEILMKCNKIIKMYSPDLIDFNFNYIQEDGISYPAAQNKIPKNQLLNREFLINKVIPVLVNINGEKEYFIENYACMKLYKKSILDYKKIRFDEDRKKGEDRPFNARFLKYAQSYYSLPDYTYNYVKTSNSLSVRFDPTALNTVIVNFETYVQLFGDQYNFYEEYPINYWCHAYINTILEQFRYKEADVETMISETIDSNSVQNWFVKFNPQNKFEAVVKRSVIAKDVQRTYILCRKKGAEKSRKDKLKKVFFRIKRSCRKLKMLKEVLSNYEK